MSVTRTFRIEDELSEALDLRAKEEDRTITKVLSRALKRELMPEEKPKTVAVQKTTVKKFVRPTVGAVGSYCRQRGNSVCPQSFIDHYAANGWMRGKNPVRDWKACVRTWEGNAKERQEVKNDILNETGWLSEELGSVGETYESNIHEVNDTQASLEKLSDGGGEDLGAGVSAPNGGLF
ncbi:MAG: hypothetical protein V3R67_08900 [Thermodesulfobacteriota bacterium]